MKPDTSATDAFLARAKSREACDNLIADIPELAPDNIQAAAEVLVDELDRQGTSSPTVDRAMRIIQLGKTARLRAQAARIERRGK